jgi:hypothetical protein
MRNHFEHDIATNHWHWEADKLCNEQIRTACLSDIAKTLRRIEAAINSLGADGIHELIRLATKQAKRRERRLKARGRKKPRLRRVA